MNVKYYPAHLSALIIDGDLAMGAHGITLDAAQTIDGVDVSLQKTNVDNLIRQMHPNVSVLAAMDESTYNGIVKSGDNYVLAGVGATIDSYSETNQDDQSILYSGNVLKVGQAFTCCVVGLLTSAKFYVKKDGSPTGNAVAKLYAATGTVGTNATATGGALATSDVFDVSTLTTNYALITFTFSSPPSLSLSADYVIAIEYSGGSAGNSIWVGSDSSSPTHAGNLCQYVANWESGMSGKDACFYVYGTVNGGGILSNALAANNAVLSFFSHLKGKFSNGDSTHANPVQVEIFGNGDSYAAALNATTKFKIDVADPIIEMYRIDDSVVAKSGAQTDWVLDDNVTNGAFAAKTTSTHETILAEEIGCASVVMIEKSVNGAFTDTEILVEDDDYTVDYSTRTATKIILTSADAADIVISQSKLRITWITDIENIDGTANTALKMKIYLNRTALSEASPEIQKIDLGTDKYAEVQYVCG